MNNRISIPKPCHENWNEMQPEEQGRHCQACSKMVIDFTSWATEDILHYVQQRSQERVCGRFYTDQVVIPEDKNGQLIQRILKAKIPLLRKIAAVIVVCFGLMQGGDTYGQEVKGKIAMPKTVPEQQIQGELAVQPADTAKQNPSLPVDSAIIKQPPVMMGMIAAPYKPPVKAGKKANIGKKQIKRKA